MWGIIIAAMPESKDMYFSVAAEFLELGVGCGVFERQELISRKAMELIEACDPKRVVMYRKFILALRRADDGSPFGQWLEASEQWSAVDAILQAIEEEEEKNKIPIRTAAAVHLAEAGPGAADGYQGVAVDLTSPPNADAPEHAAFPPAFPPAPDAGGSTVIDSPLVVRE